MPTIQQSRLEETLSVILRNVCVNTPKPLIELNDFQLEVRVNGSKDHGRCIGKKGYTHWAISSVMWWVGSAQIARPVTVKLLDPIPSNTPEVPFKPKTSWSGVSLHLIQELVEEVTFATFKTKIPWVIEKQEPGVATIRVRLPKYLQTPMSEPNYAEALTAIIRSAGLSHCLNFSTVVTWE
jgi:predicted RNA-binding protein YlqC (UPF0109 family)